MTKAKRRSLEEIRMYMKDIPVSEIAATGYVRPSPLGNVELKPDLTPYAFPGTTDYEETVTPIRRDIMPANNNTPAAQPERPRGYNTGTAAFQKKMQAAGLYDGPIDGLWDKKTQAAYNTYKEQENAAGTKTVTPKATTPKATAPKQTTPRATSVKPVTPKATKSMARKNSIGQSQYMRDVNKTYGTMANAAAASPGAVYVAGNLLGAAAYGGEAAIPYVVNGARTVAGAAKQLPNTARMASATRQGMKGGTKALEQASREAEASWWRYAKPAARKPTAPKRVTPKTINKPTPKSTPKPKGAPRPKTVARTTKKTLGGLIF